MHTHNLYKFSHEYDKSIFEECISQLKQSSGASIEIGVYEGGASKLIIDAYQKHHPNLKHIHIGIDPFGGVPYADNENQFQNKQLSHRYNDTKRWYLQKAIVDNEDRNFLFLQLESTEYFNRFPDGYPMLIQGQKFYIDKYDLVHIDAVHAIEHVVNEINFFKNRMTPKGFIILDDWDCFDIDFIDKYMYYIGFKKYKKGQKKMVYQYD